MEEKEKKKFPHVSLHLPGKEWAEKIKDRIKEKAREHMANDEMQELSAKLRLHHLVVRMRYVAAGAAALVLIIGYIGFCQVRVFHNYKVVSEMERSDDAVTEYVRVKKGRTLKCNPNGVTCVNDKNEVQWNTTFNMQSIAIDSCDSTVAVADQRGSQIYIFNEEGPVGNFDVEHVLMKVRVSGQGVTAAILEDGETTWVNVYDTNGNIIVKNKTSMAESGYPMDIAISENGQKLAVAYLALDQDDLTSRVAFYNFSSVGQGKSDYLVNSAEYKGQIVPEVQFLDESHVVAFCDDGLDFFSGRQVPEERKRVQFQEELISVFCDEEYVGIVTASDEAEKTHRYKMQLYRSNGTRTMTKYFDMDYKEIKVAEGEIMMFNDRRLEIYTESGKKKAALEYQEPIMDILPSGGSRTYTIVTADSTDQIRIK